MTKQRKKVLASDLKSKRYTAPDGTVVQMKVVRADSATFGWDMQAAFRSNVRRILETRRERKRAADHPAEA